MSNNTHLTAPTPDASTHICGTGGRWVKRRCITYIYAHVCRNFYSTVVCYGQVCLWMHAGSCVCLNAITYLLATTTFAIYDLREHHPTQPHTTTPRRIPTPLTPLPYILRSMPYSPIVAVQCFVGPSHWFKWWAHFRYGLGQSLEALPRFIGRAHAPHGPCLPLMALPTQTESRITKITVL